MLAAGALAKKIHVINYGVSGIHQLLIRGQVKYRRIIANTNSHVVALFERCFKIFFDQSEFVHDLTFGLSGNCNTIHSIPLSSWKKP